MIKKKNKKKKNYVDRRVIEGARNRVSNSELKERDKELAHPPFVANKREKKNIKE